LISFLARLTIQTESDITRKSPERGLGPGNLKFKAQNPRVTLDFAPWILNFFASGGAAQNEQAVGSISIRTSEYKSPKIPLPFKSIFCIFLPLQSKE
jgi:hypothetical protein